MSDRGKLLVLGASGLLGRHVSSLLGSQRVVTTYRSHPVEGAIYFDALSMRLRDTLLRGRHGFFAALVLYGVTKLDDCARDPAGTSLVNVRSIRDAIVDLTSAGVKPVFASSDAVFDGSRGMWKESDPTRPILTYGRQKLEVERYLQANPGSWVIARLSKLVSSIPEPRNLLNEWADQIDGNEEIRCASDLVFSPADVNDAAQALIRLAEEPFSGLFHVCGPRPVNRLQFLNMLTDTIGARAKFAPRVSVCRMSDLKFYEARPLNVSMQPEKLYAALGVKFRSLESICSEFVNNRYVGVPDTSRNAR